MTNKCTCKAIERAKQAMSVNRFSNSETVDIVTEMIKGFEACDRTMITRTAIEGISAAWSTRLATMPDDTAEQRNERVLVAQFITDLGRVLEAEQ